MAPILPDAGARPPVSVADAPGQPGGRPARESRSGGRHGWDLARLPHPGRGRAGRPASQARRGFPPVDGEERLQQHVGAVGILGAALATLLSYAALLGATTAFSQRELAVTLPGGALVRGGVLALVMYVLVVQIDAGGRLATLVVRVAAGVLIYGSGLLAVDSPTREQGRRGLERVRGRSRT